MKDTSINEKQINELLAAWYQKTDGRRCRVVMEYAPLWSHLELGTGPVSVALFTRSLDSMKMIENAMGVDQQESYAWILAGDGRDVRCCVFADAWDRAEAALRAIGEICDHEEITDKCSECAYERRMDGQADKAAL